MASMKTLADLVHGEVVSIAPSATVLEAAKLMAERQIGSLLVLEGQRLTGILTERDLLFRVMAPAKDPGRLKVADVMTKNPVTASATMGIDDALDIMRKHHFRHLLSSRRPRHRSSRGPGGNVPSEDGDDAGG
jgi:CBS domain-containing protein